MDSKRLKSIAAKGLLVIVLVLLFVSLLAQSHGKPEVTVRSVGLVPTNVS